MVQNVLLMIDDDPASFDRVQRYLDADMYCLHHATDPFEGVRLAKQLSPDIVILDIRMPDLDGYEACRRLQGQEATRSIPIVIYSVLGDQDDAYIRSLNLGAYAVVQKGKLSRLSAALERFAGEDKARQRRPSMRKFRRQGYELRIQGEAERVWLDGQEKVLRPLERKLLSHLVEHSGVFVTTNQLGKAVWGKEWEYLTKGSVYRLMNGLRAKLEPIPGKWLFVDSQPRIGYRLLGEDEQS